MGLECIEAGQKLPDDVNVVIEIPAQSHPVKYEMDKASGVLKVDRFLGAAMFYPCDYGFVPYTLSEDGDPVDVLVVSPYPLLAGVVIRCRPVGLLRMTDESGQDAKILAVPIAKLTTLYQHVHQPTDFHPTLLRTIEHFFQHYKDLEEGKWVKVDGWENVESAKKEILASVKRYQEKEEVV